MNKIQIANILLTRRCNLNCSYCHIVKDYEKMPEQYPKMNYYRMNELDYTQWIYIISKLKFHNSDIFLIFYGGEPFVYDGLDKLIMYCHSENINYTIISNNTEQIQSRINSLYNKIGTIKGFTASVDPVLVSKEENDIVKKSKEGFKNLIRYKKNNWAEDVVAEITLNDDNIKYLYDTINLLSDNGIYSSITAIDLKKNDYYDFSGIIGNSEFDKLSRNLINKKYLDVVIEEALDKKLLVHSPLLLTNLYECLPYDMYCKINKDIHNITIDSDGRLRLCLRIRGTEIPQIEFFKIFDEDGNIIEDVNESMKRDYNNYCKGCNWTCMFMSGKHFENIIDH